MIEFKSAFLTTEIPTARTKINSKMCGRLFTKLNFVSKEGFMKDG